MIHQPFEKKSVHDALQALSHGKMTSDQLQDVVDWARSKIRRSGKYSGLDSDTIDHIIQGALKDFSQAPLTKLNKEPNYGAYFTTTLHSALADHYRKQPDGRIYTLLKEILQTELFCNNKRTEGKKIRWEYVRWYPSEWDNAEPIDQEQLSYLLQAGVSFGEAGIEPIDVGKKKARFRKEPLAAYVLHLFSFAEQQFSRLSFKISELKEIICTKLWIVPRDPTSVSDRSTNNGDSASEQDLVDRLGDAPIETVEILHLEYELQKMLKNDPLDLRLWLLYKWTEDPNKGFELLAEELKMYKALPQKGKSTLHAMRSNELSVVYKELAHNDVDLSVDGSLDVIEQVLGRHFRQYLVQQ